MLMCTQRVFMSRVMMCCLVHSVLVRTRIVGQREKPDVVMSLSLSRFSVMSVGRVWPVGKNLFFRTYSKVTLCRITRFGTEGKTRWGWNINMQDVKPIPPDMKSFFWKPGETLLSLNIFVTCNFYTFTHVIQIYICSSPIYFYR